MALLTMTAVPAAAQVPPLAPSCGPEGESKVSEPGPYGILPQEVVEVPSSLDGRPIQIGIVRPDLPAGEKAPVLVHTSPYHAADLKEIDIRACAAFLVENYVPHGYAVALVPTRGTGDSDGCPNLFGRVERADANDALTYLGTQPWSAGKIAMYGLSYDGSTPWVAAATGNPYLKTILPVSGVNDIWDLSLGKGTLDWRFWFFVSGYYHYYGPVFNNPVLSGRDAQRTLNAATTCPDVVQGEAASAESALTGETDSFGYWEERRLRPMVERNYKGSVLLIQGLQDWNVRPAHTIPWAVSLKKKGLHVEQLLGQWNHAHADMTYTGEHARWDFADQALAWFDRFLKGEDASTGAAVEVEDSAGEWRREKRWPPRNRHTLHLTAGRTLATEPSDTTASAVLAQDSRSRHYLIGSSFPAETTDADDPTPEQIDGICVTCVAFTMPVKRQFRMSGLPEVFVDVTPTAPSGHVAAALYRRGADGVPHRLGWGVTDLRFPQGENRPDDTPEEVTPGAAKRVRIEIEPLEAVVPAGEELVLILGQGNGMQLAGRPAGPVQLAFGGGDSFIRFHRARPKRSQFFTPPPPEGRQLP